VSSTRSDAFPRFSPDGERIAFQSARTGVTEIWICRSDGSDLEQLTEFGNGFSGSPDWSPDGRHIVFDRLEEGHWDLFSIPASGGVAVRLTFDPADDYAPNWSCRGDSIYFVSDRSGSANVWRVPASGGGAKRITKRGGGRPRESKDGERIFYLKAEEGEGSLWEASVNGGPEKMVVQSVRGPSYAVTDSGIYFMRPPLVDGSSAIQRYRFSDGGIETVAPVEGMGATNWTDVAVSPDERWIIYRRTERYESDLMLIDGFR
jgi:Tol biopolymer transport system component